MGRRGRDLDLDNNQLRGSIPSTISSLTALTYVDTHCCLLFTRRVEVASMGCNGLALAVKDVVIVFTVTITGMCCLHFSGASTFLTTI